MIMKIGFIGAGSMGMGMVKNLARGGHELIVCGRDEKKLSELRPLGINISTRPADAAKGEVVFLCLLNSDANDEVCYGSGGLIDTMSAGQVLVDCGTSRYHDSLKMYDDCLQRGISFIDAPISGLPERAQSGELTIMCGGDKPAFEQILPLLECMGSSVIYMGKAGSGQLVKLINQLFYNINCAAIAEILPMAVKLGLDPVQVAKVVNTGTARSHAGEFFIPKILKGDFNGGLPLAQAYKDMISISALSAKEQIPLPVLSAAAATYQTALQKGLGGYGKGAMIKIYEDLLGVEFRETPDEGGS